VPLGRTFMLACRYTPLSEPRPVGVHQIRWQMRIAMKQVFEHSLALIAFAATVLSLPALSALPEGHPANPTSPESPLLLPDDPFKSYVRELERPRAAIDRRENAPPGPSGHHTHKPMAEHQGGKGAREGMSGDMDHDAHHHHQQDQKGKK
jgi:hypothetical protein